MEVVGDRYKAQPGLEVRHDVPYSDGPKQDHFNTAAPQFDDREVTHQHATPQSRRPTWLVLCIATAVVAAVVGGAVGGGLGASLSKCKSDHRGSTTTSKSEESSPLQSSPSCSTSPPASTSYATTTGGLLLNYQAEPTARISTVSFDCSTLQGRKVAPKSGGLFTYYCDSNFANGYTAQEGSVMADIMGMIAYSVDDCVQGCAEINAKATKYRRADTERCRSATFVPQMVGFADVHGGNCWLKNGTVSDPSSSQHYYAGGVTAMIDE